MLSKQLVKYDKGHHTLPINSRKSTNKSTDTTRTFTKRSTFFVASVPVYDANLITSLTKSIDLIVNL